MSTIAGIKTSFRPSVPQTYEELGISESLVLDWVLRRLLMEGLFEPSIAEQRAARLHTDHRDRVPPVT